MGILEADTIKKTGMKEKYLKRASQENEKTTGKQTILKKFYQKDKQLGCLPCKILETIVEVDTERT